VSGKLSPASMVLGLCLLVLQTPRFKEVASIRGTSEPTQLIWRPRTHELWYKIDNTLTVWPSGRPIHLPNPRSHIVSFSPSGSKVLLSDSDLNTSTEYDLRTKKLTPLKGEVSSASWKGEKLWWIEDEHRSKAQQWLCTAKSRRLLPSKWWIGAFQIASGLAIGRDRAHLSAATILRFDLHSLKLTPFKKLNGISEYPSCDYVDWNPKLKLGIATYSGDSGGTTCSMEVFSARRSKGPTGYAFVEGGPDWFGSQVAVDLRDFEDIGPHTNGSDTYSIVLLDPHTMKPHVIAQRIVKFLPWKTEDEADKSGDARMTADRFGGLVASPEGYIAYTSRTKGSWKIHIIKRT